jgi:hypothetical protein
MPRIVTVIVNLRFVYMIASNTDVIMPFHQDKMEA